MNNQDFSNEKCAHDAKAGEEGVGSTDHLGYVWFKNDWGSDLYSVTVRHRRSNDASKQEQITYDNVRSGETMGPLQITYTTGAGSPFDYWWIKFSVMNGATFSIKNNFYCYISSSDDGKVTLRLDGADKKLYVSFSDSSGCTVGIDQVPGDAEDETA